MVLCPGILDRAVGSRRLRCPAAQFYYNLVLTKSSPSSIAHPSTAQSHYSNCMLFSLSFPIECLYLTDLLIIMHFPFIPFFTSQSIYFLSAQTFHIYFKFHFYCLMFISVYLYFCIHSIILKFGIFYRLKNSQKVHICSAKIKHSQLHNEI